MEVRINKEVRNYQESLFFGLSLRQFLFSLVAVAVAVGIYFGLRPVLGNGEIGWVCVLAAFPFALGGFFQYNGMDPDPKAALVPLREFICNSSGSCNWKGATEP